MNDIPTACMFNAILQHNTAHVAYMVEIFLNHPPMNVFQDHPDEIIYKNEMYDIFLLNDVATYVMSK